VAELFDTSTMQRVEIPDADAPAAVLSGRYGLDASREVLLQGPDGKMYAMPATSAPEAFEKGYTFGSQEALRSEEMEAKYGALGSKLLAGGAGVLRGATLGLSDRALRNVGVGASTLRDLEEAAPITSGVGEGVGAVATTLLTGGAAGVGQGAVRATGLAASKGLLARAGAKALELGVTGAIEGAAFGAGQAITEDALGRADLTAESLIANAGLGAIVGGSGGVLLGGGGVLAGAGIKKGVDVARDKLAGSSVAEWLEDFAGERALKATLGQQKRAFTQLEDKNLTEKAKKYLLEDVGIDKLDTTESIAEKLAAKVDDLDARRIKMVEQLDQATEATPLERISRRQVATEIRKEMLPKIDKAAQRNVYDAMERYADDIAAEGNGGMPFSEAANRRAKAQLNANYDSNNPGPLREAWAEVARIWNRKIDEAADPVLKSLGEQTDNAYKAVREEMALAIKLKDYAENRVQGNAANRFVSPSDYGFGAAVGVMQGDPVTGLFSAGAHKFVRERGNAFAANMAHRASKLQAIKAASQAVTKRVDTAVTSLLSKARRGAALSAIPPVTVNALSGASFMPKSAAAEAPKDRKEAAKLRSRELAELIADPQRLADRVAVALSDVDKAAPGVSGQAALTATKALQFLANVAPKNAQSTNTLQPLLDDWKPTDQEVSRFERHVRAAFDPLSVLDDLEKGVLTKEAADTLRELYPQLHQVIATKIAGKLAESKERLPYVDRVNLSLLLGAPVDDSMRPDFISRTQQMWARKPSEGGGQRAPATSSVNLASNMRSPTQRLEEKR
jgi:hypothetical protein